MEDEVNMTWQYEGHMAVIYGILGGLMGKILMTHVTTKDRPCRDDGFNMVSF